MRLKSEIMCEPWIASLHLEPAQEFSILGDDPCAYTDVVAWVKNPKELENVVNQWLEIVGVRLVSMDDAEPVRLRLQHDILDEEQERLVDLAKEGREGVHFSPFELEPRRKAVH
jgi:hypothetical protein